MDPAENIPERSKLWLDQKNHVVISGNFFDPVTKIFFVFIMLFTFVIFWPIISNFNFEAVFYTPFIPSIINIFGILGIAERSIVALIYLTSFIVSVGGVYLLVRYLTRRQSTAIFAGLFYIIWPIPIFVLLFFTGRVFESGLVSPASFLSIIYGEVDYFFALALLPYAALFFLNYLKYARKIDLLSAVILCLLIFLANQSQSLSLILVLSVLSLTEIFLGQFRLKIKRAILLIVISLGLASFWYIPIAIASPTAIFTSHVVANLKLLFPLPAIVGILSLIISFAFFAKRQDRQVIFLSFLLLVVFSSLVGDWLLSGRSYVAHPNRLIPNMIMFGSVVLASAATALLDKVNLAGRVNFEKWSLLKKIIGSIFFGIISFAVLSITAVILTPIGIRLVTGEGGIWTKIRMQMITERAESMANAGGNFELVIPAIGYTYWLIGAGLTLFFILFLGWVFLKKDD